MYRWLFELCRLLGRAHPRRLLEELTAEELYEWWLLYQDEPWGELRADARTWAAAQWGADGVRLSWPYIDIVDPEELLAEMERLEELTADDHCRQDIDPAGSPDGQPAEGLRGS